MVIRYVLSCIAVLSLCAAVVSHSRAQPAGDIAQAKDSTDQSGQASQPSDQDEEKPYVVKDGKVDQKTYNGWRRYTAACMRCHGPDGAGSSYGPDLVESLKNISEVDFREVVVNGRINPNNAESVMPPFGEVQDVAYYLDDIYAYLKARSDGVLGRGRPERFDR